jgi:hydroxymethylpyrimidine pyrophosphatase-like HAD family hydrolase
MASTVQFNNKVRLFLADVDHTIAETYAPAMPEMIKELSSLLDENRAIYLVTGGGLVRVRQRIVDQIPAKLRCKIIIAHCSGAEVWGFDEAGNIRSKPYYTLYDSIMIDIQKKRWREIVAQLIKEFKLEVYDPMPRSDFVQKFGNDPLKVMMEDRGPQITFEVDNGYDLTPEQEASLEISVPQTYGALDLRIPILERADQLFRENNLPVTPRLGGLSALDFALKGVSKARAVKYVIDNNDVLNTLGLSIETTRNPQYVEIWGDRFDRFRGGTDRHMQEAVSQEVRAIDFREEDPESFLPGYNIVVWDGKKHLQDGLLEFLQTRKRRAG